jgi:hypothetical protein
MATKTLYAVTENVFISYLTLKSPVVTMHTTCYNILKLCILARECIYVFRMVLTINSDCFSKQH